MGMDRSCRHRVVSRYRCLIWCGGDRTTLPAGGDGFFYGTGKTRFSEPIDRGSGEKRILFSTSGRTSDCNNVICSDARPRPAAPAMRNGCLRPCLLEFVQALFDHGIYNSHAPTNISGRKPPLPVMVAGHSAAVYRYRGGSASSWGATCRALHHPVPTRSRQIRPASANRIAVDNRPRPPARRG